MPSVLSEPSPTVLPVTDTTTAALTTNADLAVHLVRDDRMPAWRYTGPLAEGKAHAEHVCRRVEYSTQAAGRRGDIVHIVTTESARGYCSTTADTEHDAWQIAIASLLSGDQPYCDFALPGESVADLLAREPDAPGPDAYHARTGRQPGTRAEELMTIPHESTALASHPVLAAVDTTPQASPARVVPHYGKAALLDYATAVAALPAGATPDTHQQQVADVCATVAHARESEVDLGTLRRYRGTVPVTVISAAWDAAVEPLH